MDFLKKDQVQFSAKGSYRGSIDEAHQLLRLLTEYKEQTIENSSGSAITPTKLQFVVKRSLDAINTNLRDVHKASQTYSRCLDRRMKAKPGSTFTESELSSDTLLDRGIGMHLLREGQFRVAAAFLNETSKASTPEIQKHRNLDPTPDSLKDNFLKMYYVLVEMRTKKNLAPAMAWVQSNSQDLQARGSNLEFELARLHFASYFTEVTPLAVDSHHRQKKALMYAREALSSFGGRYIRSIQQLIGAMAFGSDLKSSPYSQIFHNPTAWEDVALSFTREFCSLLGLSADSPLFIAATAGAIALPMLEKLRNIMKEKRTEWTTEHELPVEIPLPMSYRFHSIFVCPVSKEQTTDNNPPMLLPCGHILAQESLTRLSRLGTFKCPYCPEESHHRDARKVVL